MVANPVLEWQGMISKEKRLLKKKNPKNPNQQVVSRRVCVQKLGFLQRGMEANRAESDMMRSTF